MRGECQKENCTYEKWLAHSARIEFVLFGSGFQKEEHPGPALKKVTNLILDPDPNLDPDLTQFESKRVTGFEKV